MKPLGPRYKKSLQELVNGPKNLDEDKPTVTRYRNLEDIGLVQGTGVRVVGLTKAGRRALANGFYETERVEIKEAQVHYGDDNGF